jgi:hypothetical protein
VSYFLKTGDKLRIRFGRNPQPKTSSNSKGQKRLLNRIGLIDATYCAMPLRKSKSSYNPRWRRSGFFGAVSGLGGRLGAQARDRAFGRPRDTTRQHLSASGAG